jgi:hypothetical protein
MKIYKGIIYLKTHSKSAESYLKCDVFLQRAITTEIYIDQACVRFTNTIIKPWKVPGKVKYMLWYTLPSPHQPLPVPPPPQLRFTQIELAPGGRVQLSYENEERQNTEKSSNNNRH